MRHAGSIWTWTSVVLVFILAWRAFMWYPQLPDRFPIHFDASGSPDRWIAKQPITWALIPLFATALVRAAKRMVQITPPPQFARKLAAL